MIAHPYVTVAEWNAYLRAKGDDPTEEDSTMPFVYVSAIEADTYCAWAKGRLPTDAELDGQFCPVWEWTATMDGEYRVVRGGSWLSNARSVRASYRDRLEPAYRSNDIGFRCVREGEK